MTNLETIFAMGGIGLTVLGMLAGAAWALSGKLDQMRKESSEGRRDIHSKIDGLRDWAMSTFVTRELYQERVRAHEADIMRLDAGLKALTFENRRKKEAGHDSGPTE